MLCEKEQIILTKNTDRYTTGFLTGEPDILQTLEERKIIRDIKIAENWETFRNVEGISSQYYYQGVGYCFLTNSSLFYLDYFLIPNYFNWEVPEKFLEMETAIGNLPLNKRIKTYAITSSEISQEIPFIINRLSKAHSYYNNLSYNICMKFN
jgi:5-methylcytosine-specific restriction endonuclease McrBC regulatory subunit McrC